MTKSPDDLGAAQPSTREIKAAELALERSIERTRSSGIEIEGVYRHALFGYVARLDKQQVAELRRDADVEVVVEDHPVTVFGDDPAGSWGQDRVDQRGRGRLDGRYNWGLSGAGATIYVLDTGVRVTHSEFGGRASGGASFIRGENGRTDANGHGTHVAAIAAGKKFGVAKNARIVSVQVLDRRGNGQISTIVAGLDWVIANRKGPSVINMSLGGPNNAALDRAVTRAYRAGIVVVDAAGNSNRDACKTAPASNPHSLTVGATGWKSSSGSLVLDQRAGYSNYGRCVNIWAPGTDIKSASSRSNSATMVISGTSMAAPIVAGVAAIHFQQDPKATSADINKRVQQVATRDVVLDARNAPDNLVYSRLGTQGDDTAGVFRPSDHRFRLAASHFPGSNTLSVTSFGRSSDIPLVGDWDGNGTDTIGLYRPSKRRFYLKNNNGSSKTISFVYGGAGVTPIVGDWNGDGKDTIGIVDPKGTFYLRNSNTAGKADIKFRYGRGGNLIPLTGDWNGDGKDTIGIYEPAKSKFMLRNSNSGGKANITYTYGAAGDVPVTGNWDNG